MGTWNQLSPEQQKLLLQVMDALKKGDMAEVERLLLGRAKPDVLWSLLSKIGSMLAGPDTKPLNLSDGFWNEMARRSPESSVPHSALGDKKLKEGKHEEAKEAYNKAIEKGGVTADNLVGRGVAKDGLGDVRGANADARAALDLDPANKNAQGLLHLTTGRMQGLRLDAKAPKAGAPDWEAAHGSPGPAPAAARQGQASPASQGVNPLAQSSQWTQESVRAFKLGDFRSALRAATTAVDYNARNLQALNLRAMAKDRLGDKKGAAADATEGLKLKPDDTTLLNTRAWAENGMAAYDQALADGKQVVGLEPDNGFGHLNVGRAEGGLGRRSEMLEALRKAAGLDSRFAPVLDAALRLPARADSELLFKGALPAAMEPPQGSRPRRFLTLVGLCIAGGVLIALGLLHVLSPDWRKSVTQMWRRKVGEALAAAGGPSTASDLPIGKFWEYYSPKRKLGEGGMGVVYEAVDRSLDRRVAVKRMRGEVRDDPDVRRQFLKEARFVAALHHPNIADIYSIIEDDAELYMVFEFLDGKTLESLLADRGRLPLDEAVALMRGACAAVQHAHERGVIHRDLKPGNIMVTPQGEAKVMDFGIARQVRGDSKTVVFTENLCGTPAYMAPEAEQGEVGTASDVFSLGVCLYEMVTGRAPFAGPPATMHIAKLSANFDPATRQVPALPRSLDKVIGRSLATIASARYAGPALLYADLERLLAQA